MSENSTILVNFASANNYFMVDLKYNRLRVVLAERDLTNRWLAEKIGVSDMTVSRWVSNKRQPPIEQLFVIAAALNISPKELINDTIC